MWQTDGASSRDSQRHLIQHCSDRAQWRFERVQRRAQKTRLCLIGYSLILMKKTDFLSQPPPSHLFITPLFVRPSQRDVGLIPPSFLYSSSKLRFFSPRPLSANFGCNAGKLQNVSNNVIQVEQGRKLTFSFVSAAWASPSSPSSDTLSLGCKRCQIQLGQGVESQKCFACRWWIQRQIPDNLGANTH